MNCLRLECLKLSRLKERRPTETENPNSYSPLNGVSPNHVQPPDHHYCCKDDLVGLIEYLGAHLIGRQTGHEVW